MVDKSNDGKVNRNRQEAAVPEGPTLTTTTTTTTTTTSNTSATSINIENLAGTPESAAVTPVGTVAGNLNTGTSSTEASAKTSYEKFLEKLREAYKTFRAGTFSPEDWDSIQTHGQTIYSQIIREYNTAKGLPPQGIIPTTISFTIDGVGGLKIGQSFRINKGVLPERYNENFGYIITGLMHKIEQNRWMTEVTGQTYYVGKPAQEDIDKAKLKLQEYRFPVV